MAKKTKKTRDPDVEGLGTILQALVAMSPRGRYAAINWVIDAYHAGVFESATKDDAVARTDGAVTGGPRA